MVAAEAQELAPLARALGASQAPALAVRWSRAGWLGRSPVVLVANGPGRENAARAVREVCDREPVRGIVSTGWCGALDPALRVGDVVVADRVLSARPPAEFPASRPVHEGPAAQGGLLTVDHFVSSAEEKESLRLGGAIAVDMEAAGVAGEASRRALPLFCVRTVSDPAGRSFRLDFNQARRTDGSFSAAQVALLAGLRPARWRELFRFWQDAGQAATALARFLGGCRFEV